jgi:hypothetical protein
MTRFISIVFRMGYRAIAFDVRFKKLMPEYARPD